MRAVPVPRRTQTRKPAPRTRRWHVRSETARALHGTLLAKDRGEPESAARRGRDPLIIRPVVCVFGEMSSELSQHSGLHFITGGDRRDENQASQDERCEAKEQSDLVARGVPLGGDGNAGRLFGGRQQDVQHSSGSGDHTPAPQRIRHPASGFATGTSFRHPARITRRHHGGFYAGDRSPGELRLFYPPELRLARLRSHRDQTAP